MVVLLFAAQWVVVDARDSENATAEGLYCSQACANHAGGELHVAQAEHRGGR